MEYVAFEIKNFKGIEHLRIDLRKVTGARVSALIGLNESGKTTVLEAINFFNKEKQRFAGPFTETQSELEPNNLVPISQKANFNGLISVKATLSLDARDIQDIQDRAKKRGYQLDLTRLKTEFSVERKLNYRNSEYFQSENFWEIGLSGKPKSGKKFQWLYTHDKEAWLGIVNEMADLLPPILFFPTFLFDIPEKIYLELKEADPPAGRYYKQLLQDVLDSLNDDLQLETHVIDRLKPSINSSVVGKILERLINDKNRLLQAVLRRMETKISSVVFERWAEVFSGSIPRKDIKIEAALDEQSRAYVQISIGDGDSLYLIRERSLGFRWFFCFLLFTEFRTYRKGQRGILFLFDEPASNLHARAQQQLLDTFGRLAQRGNRVLYSTHSHYMINPKWLEQAFIVKNAGLDYDSDDGLGYNYTSNATRIDLLPYRQFVSSYPNQTTYFRPALDALDYQPSSLEPSAKAILVEGKNDYYALKYAFSMRNISFSIFPGNGASGLNSLISLFLGWGSNFLILLDDDKEGRLAKKRYLDEWGIEESRVLTIGDASSALAGHRMEQMFSEPVQLAIVKSALGSEHSLAPNKKAFNRALQSACAANAAVELDAETAAGFEAILTKIEQILSPAPAPQEKEMQESKQRKSKRQS